MTQTRFAPLAAAVFALFLSACEGSPVPLSSPPSIAVDTTLAGTWEAVDLEAPGQHERMLVLPFNDFEYYVEYYGTEIQNDMIEQGDTMRFRVFLTEIDGRSMANIQCIQCDSPAEFLFMQVEAAGGRLTLTPIDNEMYDEFEEMTNPMQAYERLSRAFTEGMKMDEHAVFTFKGRDAQSWHE